MVVMLYPRRARTVFLFVSSILLSYGGWEMASGEAIAAAAAKPNPPQCNPATFQVVVDVGHTAEKVGAKSARGAGEYEFNLRLAKRIEQDLLAAGFAKTMLMITTDWSRAGLAARAERANRLPADLFLSIHHDSVPDRFLEKWEYEGETRGYSDRFKGHSLFVSIDNGDYKGSVLFGTLLGNQLKERGLAYTPHYTEKFMGSRRRILVDQQAGVYRYDQLIVLKSTRMPAVLLEAGSIINRDEELLLAAPERQVLISAAVVDAVKAFCTARAERSPTAAPKQQPTAAPKQQPAAAPKQQPAAATKR
jgi:N-acetylmuramoyl-L-alanine amidase